MADDQGSALHNLDASSQQLTTFFDQLGPFADASRPAFRSLGSASKTGDRAVNAAPPVIAQLAAFAAGTPELSKNLSIVLQHLDDRKHAVEKDPRSPGGQGYTGLEALLQYVYDQTTSTSIFDQNNHILKVGAFVGPCANYASEETLKKDPSLERQCGSRLGPIQPGLSYPDVTKRATPAEARDRGARKRADGNPGLPLPAVPAPVDAAPGAGDALGPRDAVAAPRPLHADGPDPHRAGPAAARPAAPARHRRRQRPARLVAAAATAEAQREDQQRPAGPDPAPGLPARPMKRARRSNASIVANPVLIGAVTTLVLVVAVFLAYNANNGLPFVPTRELNVLVSNGANLVKGNEVRSGGFRIGVVTDMTPVMLPDSKVGAKLTLKLDKKAGAVPIDSKAVIRPRSALGLKYVELDTGRSKKVFADGATLPASQASVPVEIDEFFNMFDEPTRRASQGNLQGFGDALAGRGTDLNQTIQVAPELFDHLGSVMANLSAPRTELPSFFKELGDTARVIAPVSATNAHLFTTMANTFEALSRDPQALKDTIAKSPSTLRAGTRRCACSARSWSTPRRSRAISTRPPASCAARCPPSTPRCASAPPCSGARSRSTTTSRARSARSRTSSRRPTTVGALRGLTATVGTLQPQVRFLGPFVTVCNTWNQFWTFAAEHFSAPDDTGSSERALLNMAAGQPGTDAIGSQGANEFAHGKGALPGSAEQYVHNNVYGPAIDEHGNADCGAGQTGYIQAYNPLRDKSVKGDPYQGAVTERFPISGRLGPTYAQYDREGKGVGLNPQRVPAGETFTDRPGGRGVDIARPAP